MDPRMDPESRAWVAALSGEGGDREAALARLHELLLRAARFELGRRRGQLARLSAAERHDLAVQAADDAMMSVLARLADFRGLSRFSTWAYKFALLEAATKARRLAWRDRELPRPPEDWAALADPGGRPEAAAEHAELLAALRAAVAEVLTPHQREVLLTVVAGRVPLDVLAERRGTTRGALYKTIHDARRKLRAHLAASGLPGPEEPEVGCDDCFAELDRYVELELAGADPDTHLPGLRAHLAGCQACREEHESLRALLTDGPG